MNGLGCWKKQENHFTNRFKREKRGEEKDIQKGIEDRGEIAVIERERERERERQN